MLWSCEMWRVSLLYYDTNGYSWDIFNIYEICSLKKRCVTKVEKVVWLKETHPFAMQKIIKHLWKFVETRFVSVDTDLNYKHNQLCESWKNRNEHALHQCHNLIVSKPYLINICVFILSWMQYPDHFPLIWRIFLG